MRDKLIYLEIYKYLCPTKPTKEHQSESYNFLANALPPFEEIVVDKATP